MEVTNALTVTPHPVTLEGQRHIAYELIPGETLDAFLRRHVENIGTGAWVVTIGGHEVPAKLWSKVRPKNGTVIECRSVVQKQAIALVAVVLIAWFAPYLATGIYGALGGTYVAANAGIYLAVIQAAVTVGGSMLVNKMLGPKMPSADSLRDSNASATYKLGGGRNRARQYEPLGLLFGELRITPDYASLPWTYFGGEDQYMWCVFHGGINCASVSDIRIGQTPISQFEEVQQYSAKFSGMPDQALPGYANVDTLAGPSLPAGVWVSRTSAPGTVVLQVDFEGSLYATKSKGGFKNEYITLFGEYRRVGTSDWLPFFDGVNNVVLASMTTKPLRVTYSRAVPEGQYEVRFNKSDPDLQDGGRVSVLNWSQLKSVQYDTGNYRSSGRIGLNIKASGQINGAIEQLTWLATAKPMPYWDIDHWTVATTRATGISNPGAQILLFARGIYDDAGKLVAGLGLQDSMIDIESLKGFMYWCWLKGFTFDYYLDTGMSCGEVLDAIAAVGLGSITWQSGKLGVVWAAEDQPIQGVVNMATMKAKSFSVSYQTIDTADSLEYQYFDRDRDYSWQTLRVSDPTLETALNPARISGLGVTMQAHAAVLARFHLAQSIYQRKDITFDTDLEHLTYKRMALLAVTHDVTQWGYGGRVVEVANDSGVLTLTLDDEVPAGSGARYIGLRLPGETGYRVFGVSAFSGTSRTITLSTAWPAGVPVPGASAGNPAHDTIWIYDFKSTPGYRCRVTSIQPQGNMSGATVTVVPEGPEFWDFVFNGNYVPPVNQSLLQTAPAVSNLRITEQVVTDGTAQTLQLTATFDASGAYDHAQVWVSNDGAAMAFVGDARGRSLTWGTEFVASVVVEVRPLDSLGRFGTTERRVYAVRSTPAIPPDVETMAITNGVLSWPAVDIINLAGYVLRFQYGENRVWSNASPLHNGFITQSPFKPELIPPGVCTLMVKAVNLAGEESLNAATIIANLGDVIVENVILTYDDKAAGFPGLQTNCSVDGGDLLADDTGSLFWGDDDAPHFSAMVADAYWATVSYAPMEYVTQYIAPQEQFGSRLTLDVVVGSEGELFWGDDDAVYFGPDTLGFWVAPLSYGIDFRYGTQGAFWGADGDLFWPLQDTDLVWDTPTEWRPWPGSIENIGDASIDFRITVQGGVRRGGIYGLAMVFDVPDENEELNDIVIAAAGTRLPITKQYRSIRNVQLTLQDDGGTATTVRYADKASTGPLIYCYDASGVKVAGVIDARIQGVKQ